MVGILQLLFKDKKNKNCAYKQMTRMHPTDNITAHWTQFSGKSGFGAFSQ